MLLRSMLDGVALMTARGCGYTFPRDLSDSKTFGFDRSTVLNGFCLPPRVTLSARITKDGDRFHPELTTAGDVLLARPDTQSHTNPDRAPAWNVGQGDSNDSQCGCVTLADLPPRNLIDSEIARMQLASCNLRFNTKRFPATCGYLAIADPCMVDFYHWNQLQVYDSECEPISNLTTNTGADVVGFLNSSRVQ